MGAVIFDLDGTLLNSRESHYRAFKEVADVINPKNNFTMDKYLEWYSPNYFELYRKMGIEEKDWPRAVKIWRRYCISHENPDLFPDAIEVLTYLKLKKYTLAIVTGGSEERASADLERKKLLAFFPVIVYGDGFKIEELKPAPNQLEFALKELNESAEDSTYIGDTSIDIKAGQNAGMKTIAMIANPFCLFERIEESKPDVIINNLSELKKIF